MKTNPKLLSAKTLGGLLTLSLALVLAPHAARATTINLNDPTVLAPPATGTGVINGAIYTTNFLQPAGTGVIDPFLTIQASPTEQGYNGTNGNFDTMRDPQWNHPITLGSLATVTVNGTQYYQFIVDVNEPNSAATTLSLDMLSVWTSPTLQDSTSTDSTGLFNGSLGTLRYTMSPTIGVNNVLYYDKNSGSGQADISIYIPVSNFAGASSTDYLYMYQAWGNTRPSDGGYEETFAVLGSNMTSVPEASSFLPLAGVVLAVVGADWMRKRRKLEVETLA